MANLHLKQCVWWIGSTTLGRALLSPVPEGGGFNSRLGRWFYLTMSLTTDWTLTSTESHSSPSPLLSLSLSLSHSHSHSHTHTHTPHTHTHAHTHTHPPPTINPVLVLTKFLYEYEYIILSRLIFHTCCKILIFSIAMIFLLYSDVVNNYVYVQVQVVYTLRSILYKYACA